MYGSDSSVHTRSVGFRVSDALNYASESAGFFLANSHAIPMLIR
jgi:hypothetical protein